MNRLVFISIVFLATLTAIGWHKGSALAVTSVLRPQTTTGNSFYIGNKAPLQPLAFIKLPVGNIVAGGWVRTYLARQRDGLTKYIP